MCSHARETSMHIFCRCISVPLTLSPRDRTIVCPAKPSSSFMPHLYFLSLCAAHEANHLLAYYLYIYICIGYENDFVLATCAISSFCTTTAKITCAWREKRYCESCFFRVRWLTEEGMPSGSRSHSSCPPNYIRPINERTIGLSALISPRCCLFIFVRLQNAPSPNQ